jgi:hypothetical protein
VLSNKSRIIQSSDEIDALAVDGRTVGGWTIDG